MMPVGALGAMQHILRMPGLVGARACIDEQGVQHEGVLRLRQQAAGSGNLGPQAGAVGRTLCRPRCPGMMQRPCVS
ncbi:hypothetical protein UC35_18300 [Ramlibacter tataouinensis]|uniref:Uncharacterized protein n=1 Tax=Ramlibacter tataouinensis TaxID=94132 RepID=A0A127JWZ8_9BURK|nr:hypothetical protein UC35_18300 [Ramlibacter tataouinensis]